MRTPGCSSSSRALADRTRRQCARQSVECRSRHRSTKRPAPARLPDHRTRSRRGTRRNPRNIRMRKADCCRAPDRSSCEPTPSACPIVQRSQTVLLRSILLTEQIEAPGVNPIVSRGEDRFRRSLQRERAPASERLNGNRTIGGLLMTRPGQSFFNGAPEDETANLKMRPDHSASSRQCGYHRVRTLCRSISRGRDADGSRVPIINEPNKLFVGSKSESLELGELFGMLRRCRRECMHRSRVRLQRKPSVSTAGRFFSSGLADHCSSLL